MNVPTSMYRVIEEQGRLVLLHVRFYSKMVLVLNFPSNSCYF